jgi:regulator of protease activity HflC (stomatin/prohibitin superfamily)
MTIHSHDEPPGPEFVGYGKQHSALPQVPRAVIAAIGLLVLMAFTLALFSSLIVYVRPNEFGIKEVKVGASRGIHNKTYDPGYWFLKPFGLEKMHRLPRHVQVYEMSSTEKAVRQSPSHSYGRAANIQTSDGFFVDVDVTILYRIVDPYKVMTTLGPGMLFFTNGIQPKAEPIFKQAFGELKTEDFYNSPKRTEKAEKAKETLNAEMAPKGIEVDQVLVRYFKYSDEIQKNIEARKLQDQLVYMNEAEAKANTEEATTKKAKQEGEMRVKVELEGGAAYKTEKEADMDLYSRTRKADAQLLVRTAEAQAVDLKNKAMQLAGNERKVAIEMAKVLEGLEVVVVPTGGEHGVNPLDLGSMLTLFGVPTGPQAEAGPPVPLAPPAPAAPEKEIVR